MTANGNGKKISRQEFCEAFAACAVAATYVAEPGNWPAFRDWSNRMLGTREQMRESDRLHMILMAQLAYLAAEAAAQ